MNTTLLASPTTISDSILKIHRLRHRDGEKLGSHLQAHMIQNTTGVVVRPGLMATTIGWGDFLPIAENGEGSQYQGKVLVREPIYYATHFAGFGSIWNVDPNIPAVEMAADSRHLKVGDELTIFGYRRQSWKEWGLGFFKQQQPVPANMASVKITALLGTGQQSRIITDSLPWNGTGGGAAFDRHGQLVGIWVQNIESASGRYPAFARIEKIHALLDQAQIQG